jgi:hypothetical protein
MSYWLIFGLPCRESVRAFGSWIHWTISSSSVVHNASVVRPWMVALTVFIAATLPSYCGVIANFIAAWLPTFFIVATCHSHTPVGSCCLQSSMSPTCLNVASLPTYMAALQANLLFAPVDVRLVLPAALQADLLFTPVNACSVHCWL